MVHWWCSLLLTEAPYLQVFILSVYHVYVYGGRGGYGPVCLPANCCAFKNLGPCSAVDNGIKNFHLRYSNSFLNCQSKNKTAPKNFKGLSQDAEQAKFAENPRVSYFNKDLLKDTTLVWSISLDSTFICRCFLYYFSYKINEYIYYLITDMSGRNLLL